LVTILSGFGSRETIAVTRIANFQLGIKFSAWNNEKKKPGVRAPGNNRSREEDLDTKMSRSRDIVGSNQFAVNQ
jgi:hypothetical protein